MQATQTQTATSPRISATKHIQSRQTRKPTDDRAIVEREISRLHMKDVADCSSRLHSDRNSLKQKEQELALQSHSTKISAMSATLRKLQQIADEQQAE
jgi:hypothetical protein